MPGARRGAALDQVVEPQVVLLYALGDFRTLGGGHAVAVDEEAEPFEFTAAARVGDVGPGRSGVHRRTAQATVPGSGAGAGDFVRLQERLDPRGAFRNQWLRSHVLGNA